MPQPTVSTTPDGTLECLPNGQIPLRSAFSDLIPSGIPVVIVPGNGTQARYMTACCAPNGVNLVTGCYMWWEISDAHIIKDSDKPGFRTDME